MINSHQSDERAVAAVTPPALPTNGSASHRLPTAGHETTTLTASPPDCVGPIPVPPDLARTLRSLTAAAGADDFLALTVCASVLAARVPRTGSRYRIKVIRGAQEAIVPVTAETPDLSVSFRTALQQAAQSVVVTAPDTGEPVAATILISKDGQQLYAESMTNAADVPFAQSWARSFLHLLARLAAEPDTPMAAHPVVDEAERERILHGLNPHRRPEIRYRTMVGPFEEQAERTPDAVALLDENGESVSYRELNERANRLAHYLRDLGTGTGTRIGICFERGIDQIVAIYAAVKTGATYVPLDAELPDARLAYLIEDSEPLHVLTHPACRHRVPAGPWRVHDVESDRASWDNHPTTNPVADGTSAALLHILYTSGTTGRPKGVASPTAGTLANNFWMQRQYPYREGDSAVYKTSPGFDVSIWEIFWPLYHGARLVICKPGGQRDPEHLARLVEEHGITMIFFVPTVMTPFLEKVSADRAGSLRWVVSGGESMSPRVRDTFHATLPASTLVNAYGPTEAGSVTDNIAAPDPFGSVVPVGRPAENFRLTLLDENLDLVPVGMAGEAYISGEIGLAQGYWRAPGRTAERFVADPYGPPGSRMYRTGDLCRYREDGALEHLGRIDRQIKIRGQRVEPGEIESVLAAHPAVGDCAVIAHGDPVRLLAFVVPAGQEPISAGASAARWRSTDADTIRRHAATLLPDHSRPERVIPVEHIPSTVNGKIDKDKLIQIWQALVDRERRVVPPDDELEAALVEIYSRVLKTTPVSMTDTFVSLGGHSLLAFELLDECTAKLDHRPAVAQLLTGTLRDVAASIRLAKTAP